LWKLSTFGEKLISVYNKLECEIGPVFKACLV